MDGIFFPGITRSGTLDISLQTAMAHMEEEKTFTALNFVVISLPVPKRLKKRRIRMKRKHAIKKVNPKGGADLSILKNKY